MKARQPIKITDLFFVILVLVGILIYWVNIDPTGYLVYSSLIIMTLVTVIRHFLNKNHEFKYPKWLLIATVISIVITGIDRMTFKTISPLVFPSCYIFYILIQPKPAWITRP
jgi:hypothetical protein